MAVYDSTPIGAVFSRLTVIGSPFKPDTGKHAKWHVMCRCECGAEKSVMCRSLTTGVTKACGCLKGLKGIPNLKNRRHGHTAGDKKTSPTYMSWRAMMQRCYDEPNVDYHNYGGRGIVVCERWRESFENFLVDMGERPTGMTLDRFPDTSGNYEPNNCRWATAREQASNKRNNVLLMHNGEMKTGSQIAREIGMKPTVFLCRLEKGWSLERAILQPLRRSPAKAP